MRHVQEVSHLGTNLVAAIVWVIWTPLMGLWFIRLSTSRKTTYSSNVVSNG